MLVLVPMFLAWRFSELKRGTSHDMPFCGALSESCFLGRENAACTSGLLRCGLRRSSHSTFLRCRTHADPSSAFSGFWIVRTKQSCLPCPPAARALVLPACCEETEAVNAVASHCLGSARVFGKKPEIPRVSRGLSRLLAV